MLSRLIEAGEKSVTSVSIETSNTDRVVQENNAGEALLNQVIYQDRYNTTIVNYFAVCKKAKY